MKNISANDIDAVLPQTQCQLCEYSGCRPYAEAIIEGERIDKCLPGGVKTLKKIAALVNQDPTPYLDSMQAKQKGPVKAVIREAECIGCTKCIQACPVDAIIGASKFMHTIISDICTGCELCLSPCPVDCIDVVPAVTLSDAAEQQQADASRKRYQAHQARLIEMHRKKRQSYESNKLGARQQSKEARQAAIQAAIERVKQKKGGHE